MSFPLWERGLKFYRNNIAKEIIWSFPLWERGLKSCIAWGRNARFTVVPLVGTWIEISPTVDNLKAVASFPLWERGLKFTKEQREKVRAVRAHA